MKELWKRYREPIMYIIFGAVTTLVSLLSFKLFNLWLGERLYLLNNVFSWIVAVTVAYITNKLWVFNSRSWKPAVLWKEIPTFVGARVFSLVIEEAGMFLTVDLLGWGAWSLTIAGWTVGGEMLCKLIMQVVVVILNYIFSKLVIFRKKR